MPDVGERHFFEAAESGAEHRLLIRKWSPRESYSRRKTFEGVVDLKEGIIVGQQYKVFVSIDVSKHGQLSIDFPG